MTLLTVNNTIITSQLMALRKESLTFFSGIICPLETDLRDRLSLYIAYGSKYDANLVTFYGVGETTRHEAHDSDIFMVSVDSSDFEGRLLAMHALQKAFDLKSPVYAKSGYLQDINRALKRLRKIKREWDAEDISKAFRSPFRETVNFQGLMDHHLEKFKADTESTFEHHPNLPTILNSEVEVFISRTKGVLKFMAPSITPDLLVGEGRNLELIRDMRIVSGAHSITSTERSCVTIWYASQDGSVVLTEVTVPITDISEYSSIDSIVDALVLKYS